MTDIDFYILASDAPQARELMACRLAEKVYRLGRTVHIHTSSAAECQTLDQLLWTFRAGSFVPHAVAGEGREPPVEPVVIGHDIEPEQNTDVLINLGDSVPLYFSRFNRVSEIVSEQDKTAGRERFRFYRDRGYPLKSHNI
jgi:DNA polymerase-3 subunit chi